MQGFEEKLRRLAGLRPGELSLELAGYVAKPPSRDRDALIGYALLMLAQALDGEQAERYFISGYSYARTSRQPEVRRLAEELRSGYPQYR